MPCEVSVGFRHVSISLNATRFVNGCLREIWKTTTRSFDLETFAEISHNFIDRVANIKYSFSRFSIPQDIEPGEKESPYSLGQFNTLGLLNQIKGFDRS